MKSNKVLATMSVLVAFACGGDGGTGPTPQPSQPSQPSQPTQPAAPVVSAVTVSPATGSVRVGESISLSATPQTATGTPVAGKTITWATSSSSVATVSSLGTVTGVSIGTATITATADGRTGSSVITVAPPAIASIALSPRGAALLAGQTMQFTAFPRDPAGGTITGRTVVWTTSSAAVATVSASGMVTAAAPGTATITATIDDKNTTASVTVIDGKSLPTFQSPFTGTYSNATFMDHDIPQEFVDANGVFTTYWGEVHAKTGNMIDGHSGYDFSLPLGTPLLAVAPGRIVVAQTTNTPFYCPVIDKTVTDQAEIDIEHTLPGGITVRSRYLHLSRLDVRLNQTVAAGEQIGLSGNSGCSGGPHLHFEVVRLTQTNSNRSAPIDPYGWTSTTSDPWKSHAVGAESIQLWKDGVGPKLSREFTTTPSATSTFPAAITRIGIEGVRDDINPNNEFVDLSLDTRNGTSVSLDGYSIRGDVSGMNVALPRGYTLNASRPTIRIFTGSGTNTATNIFLGRPSGVWQNSLQSDCARLVAPSGGEYRVRLGGTCPSLSAATAALSVTVNPAIPNVMDIGPRP